MTTSKLTPILCALAASAICINVRADDNPAQAAARLALAKQLFEEGAAPATNAQPATNAAIIVVTHTPAPAEVVPPTPPQPPHYDWSQGPVEKPAAAVVPATPAPAATGDNPAQAAARLALAKQLFEAGSQSTSPSAPAPVVQAVAPEAPVVPAAPVAPVPPVVAAPAAVATPPPAAAAAPVIVVPTEPVKPAPAAKVNYAGKDLGLKPIAAPALPISLTKAERLNALLDKYKADQITPEEYHRQRAAILAEPDTTEATPAVPAAAPAPEAAPQAAVSAPETATAASRAVWTFDQDSGVTANDNSGNGHNVKLVGDQATWTKTAKVGGGALSLAGTSYAETPEAVVDTTHSFTVAAWVDFPTLDRRHNQTLVSIDGKEVSGFYLQVNRGAGSRFVFNRMESDDKTAGREMAAAQAAVATNTWYHVAGVYDAEAKTIALYVDGKLQQTVPFTAPWQATGKTVIGRGLYGHAKVDYLNGIIDDVRFYAAALPASEIEALAAK